MITVITGMETYPFNRLIEAIDTYVGNGNISQTVFIQLGHTKYKPEHTNYQDFVSFGELCEKITQSTAVITHAGAGSTLTCLQHGKRPIVVPRLKKFGEHVDDHQIPFAHRLAEFGLVHQVLNIQEELLNALTAAQDPAYGVDRPDLNASGITGYLNRFWDEKIDAKSRKVPR